MNIQSTISNHLEKKMNSIQKRDQSRRMGEQIPEETELIETKGSQEDASSKRRTYGSEK